MPKERATIIADRGLRQALKVAGTYAELGRRIGVSRQAVFQWRRIPAELVMDVAKATGIAAAVLRPDLYRRAVE